VPEVSVSDVIRALQIVESGKSITGRNADVVVSDPSGAYMHGPGGLFGVLGLEKDVLSTRVVPRGLAGAIPAEGSNILWPQFPYLTGFTAGQDYDDDMGICDDPPEAGSAKSCIQTAQWGRLAHQTKTLDIGRITQQINRGEFRDLRLVNSPLAGLGAITPSSAEVSLEELIDNEFKARMAAVGVEYQNELIRLVWTGNPANNNTGGGYREFPGLDILIGTGKIDSQTQQSCPSMDSYVHDFAFTDVSDDNGDTFIAWVTAIYRYIRLMASRQNMDPIHTFLCMKEELFYIVTGLWPCSYLTAGCNFTSTNGDHVVNVSGESQVQMRDAMRNGQYLLVDGKQLPVILDDGIVEFNATSDPGDLSGGEYASNVYFITDQAAGIQTLYWQYYDYSGGLTQVQTGGLAKEFWTDGGKFLWMPKYPKMRCVQIASEMEPRLILRVPWLCAKMLNVKYTPMIHARSAIIGDPNYVNGGVTDRTGYGPSYHAEWGNVF
jgi:hypothetical protein